MDLATQLNEVIEYIESHLLEKNDYEKLAKIACCSVYNVQRIFSSVTNISIADYIRKRRMSLAALELIKTDANIIDIALRYGYDSPESFSRSFQMIYNVSPSVMRKTKPNYKPFSRITISMEVKEMDTDTFKNVIKQTMEDIIGGVSIKIIKMDELVFIGKIKKDGMSQISQFWEESHKIGYTEKLYELQENFRDFGVFINNADYMIGIEKPNIAYEQSDFDEIKVPESLWAVAYGRFGSEYIDTVKCWGMIDRYLENTQYIVNEDIAIIEKYPDGAEPLDQTYMLMKPIKII